MPWVDSPEIVRRRRLAEGSENRAQKGEKNGLQKDPEQRGGKICRTSAVDHVVKNHIRNPHGRMDGFIQGIFKSVDSILAGFCHGAKLAAAIGHHLA